MRAPATPRRRKVARTPIPAISIVWLLGTEHTPAPTGSPAAAILARAAIPPAARLPWKTLLQHRY